MKYRDLQILTQREAPNNARTEGFAFLARAGYLTRENVLTPLGESAIAHLKSISADSSFFSLLSLPILSNNKETFFPIKSGSLEIIHCSSCKYSERHELASFTKSLGAERVPPLLMEKILTPDCNTIESLANFMGVPKEKTAKALMFTRSSDGKFIFVVVRGDMQMSEAKLKNLVGDFRQANAEEISGVGAVAGFASAIGLKDALVVVDDLIPQSPNLVAGANESGYHLKNTNYSRDFSAEIVADIVLANAGDSCPHCGNPLTLLDANLLADQNKIYFENILLALAENYHDEKGLTFPKFSAPFKVYLMQIPGKEMDTLAKAEEIYSQLQSAGISVLFDDRNERPGIKFNDADLIGCPWRVTVGEKNLKDGMIELKPRTAKENQLLAVSELVPFLNQGNA